MTLYCYFTRHELVGYFDNPSVNSAFTAILFPYLTYPIAILALVVLALDSARTPWLILGGSCAYALLRGKKPLQAFLALACGGVFFYKNLGRHFLVHDRSDIWLLGLTHWWQRGRIWLGEGVGSWWVTVPRLQVENKISEGYYFTSAHNDWVQWTFETGIVGLCLLLWVVIDSMYQAHQKDGQDVYALLGLSLFATFFFPLEMPAMTVLWVFLMQRQLVK